MNERSDALLTRFDGHSPLVEAFRTLRTNIRFSTLDKPVRTLLLTSTGPGEGKSTVSANLAIAMAQAGNHCVLVDADLRKPVLHKIFDLGNKLGLTNLLLGQKGLEEVLQSTSVAGVRLLASGPLPPNPGELLGSQAMQRIIDLLREEAEMVIFDAPPVVAINDAAVLASRMDGVLLVLSAGSVPREMALRAKSALEGVKAKILGVVMNNVKLTGSYGYYYY
ncbi:MAG: CpsD/CapB family tyrosine-protein kinase [Syntrophothermus sp.]